jgi:hypothetical protein
MEGEAMAKKPGEIPGILVNPDASFVSDFANEAIYIKLLFGYNTTNAKYGAGIADGGAQAGIVELYSALEGKKYPNLDNRAMSVWWIDLAMWQHLIHPLCDRLKSEPNTDHRTAMLWNPLHRMRAWDAPVESASLIKTMCLMGSGTLSIETHQPGHQGKVGGFVEKQVAPNVGDAIYIDESDPRHIGTHWGADFGIFHLHLIRPAGSAWNGEIPGLVVAAVKAKLLSEKDGNDVVRTLVG